jgi:hypothetical protein
MDIVERFGLAIFSLGICLMIIFVMAHGLLLIFGDE